LILGFLFAIIGRRRQKKAALDISFSQTTYTLDDISPKVRLLGTDILWSGRSLYRYGLLLQHRTRIQQLYYSVDRKEGPKPWRNRPQLINQPHNRCQMQYLVSSCHSLFLKAQANVDFTRIWPSTLSSRLSCYSNHPIISKSTTKVVIAFPSL
jgi:hypothetical protein